MNREESTGQQSKDRLIAAAKAAGVGSIEALADLVVDSRVLALPNDDGVIDAKEVDDLGAQVVNVRLNTLVGHMQLASERASEGAMLKKDWGTFWRIQKEMIGFLQSLGIVKKAIQRVEVAHTFDDQKSAELNALLDLERKKRARREELKKADFKVTDAVPQPAVHEDQEE